MINTTTERVPQNTAGDVNQQMRRDTEKRIAYYTHHPDQIDQRLRELDEEWDIERLIEVEAPTMSLTGLLFGIAFSRKWLLIPLFAQSMVLLHSLQGWYPLLPAFRRLGFRTEREIAIERYALKAIRGDFDGIEGNQPDAALQSAE
jgi:hypothetical protein